jgi:hypothetical protein
MKIRRSGTRYLVINYGGNDFVVDDLHPVPRDTTKDLHDFASEAVYLLRNLNIEEFNVRKQELDRKAKLYFGI